MIIIIIIMQIFLSSYFGHFGPTANRCHCLTHAFLFGFSVLTHAQGMRNMAAAEKPTKEKLLSTLDDIEVLSRFVVIYIAHLDEEFIIHEISSDSVNSFWFNVSD